MYDFGRNTYQTLVTFKFDCISPADVKTFVRENVVENEFSSVDRDQATKHAVVSFGDGSEKAPLHQLRIGPDSIAVWVGWHVPFIHWQEYRGRMLKQLMPLLKTIPISAVRSVSSQSNVLAPVSQLKEASEIPELKPARDLLRRFLPESLMARGNGYSLSSDALGTQNVEWWIGASQDPEYGNASFTSTRLYLSGQQGLYENWLVHLQESDELIQRFHSNYLSIFIKR